MICLVMRRQSLQIFAAATPAAARFPQKLQRAIALFVFVTAPPLRPAVARSASDTQPSQMYTFGPATSLPTSLGGRPQNVQFASRFRDPHARCHQVPPAPSTICCTR
jgi:hypothetical protein